jgi:hypothetical protein
MERYLLHFFLPLAGGSPEKIDLVLFHVIPGHMDPVTAIKPMEGKGMMGILGCRSDLGDEKKG